MPAFKRMLSAIVLLAFLLIPLPAQASDTSKAEEADAPAEAHSGATDSENLTINPSAIGEKRETWTSLTDLFGVNILTADSADTRERAAEALLADRAAKEKSLFSVIETAELDGDPLAYAAAAHGLFLKEKKEVLYQPSEAGLLNSGTLYYILSGAALVVLGIGSFFAATAWHKRKARKKEG